MIDNDAKNREAVRKMADGMKIDDNDANQHTSNNSGGVPRQNI